MLINTVILFLRDALPIFILLGLLMGQLTFSKKWLIGALTMGFVCSVIFIQQVNILGDMFDGTGLELALCCLHFILYGLVLALGFVLFIRPTSKPSWQTSYLALALIVVICVAKGSNFLLYFNGYLNQQNALQSMLIGTLLGLGICLSLAILLYFFMDWLTKKFGIFTPWTLLLVFAAGQLVNSLNLLVQVDVLSNAEPLWNSQWLVDNESEYGHLLNVLFGYTATPTTLQICLYILLILFPVMARYYRGHFAKPTPRGQS